MCCLNEVIVILFNANMPFRHVCCIIISVILGDKTACVNNAMQWSMYISGCLLWLKKWHKQCVSINTLLTLLRCSSWSCLRFSCSSSSSSRDRLLPSEPVRPGPGKDFQIKPKRNKEKILRWMQYYHVIVPMAIFKRILRVQLYTWKQSNGTKMTTWLK